MGKNKFFILLIIISLVIILFLNVNAFGPTGFFVSLFSSPEIINATVYPKKATIGQVQLTTVEVKDGSGISSITADINHENGFDTVELYLIKGSKYHGTYEARWIVHNTKNFEWYNTTVKITDILGRTAAIKLEWQDPSPSHSWTQIEDIPCDWRDNRDNTFTPSPPC